MKVLWITHDVINLFISDVNGKPTSGGSWIAPLFYSLNENEKMKMGVITPVIEGEFQKIIKGDAVHYSIPIRKGDNKKEISKELAENYLRAIHDYEPDIIHVHGVEANFGEIVRFINPSIPIVCSIQGIINSYYSYLKVSVSNINYKAYKSIKNLLGRGGVDGLLKSWIGYMPIEQNIISTNKYFIGRTIWDQSQLKAMNPEAIYFQGEELLRLEFYNKTWELEKCTKHLIFVSSAAYPIKGFHTILRAVHILKRKYPNIKLVAPLSANKSRSNRVREFLFGEDYARYIRCLIKDYDLQGNIELLNRLNSEEMASYYSQSHIFVLPSFIENSPNSLGEAMMIGTPSVVSPVGGVLSMVKDNESALVFPSGDYATLANQIDRLFSNDKLAVELSIKAKEIAKTRHDYKITTEQYQQIYEAVIKAHNSVKNIL